MTAYEKAHKNTADLHYAGPDRNGAYIIIDAAEIAPVRFEVAALRGSCELAMISAHSLEEARSVYNRLYNRYVTPTVKRAPAPLAGKYAQLRDDLRAALQAGRDAEKANPEDGGTCNFDSASLFLPRWNAAKVEQAAKEAGTHCFKWSLFGRARWVFCPDSCSQANARSRNAEAMTAALRKMGYDAFNYCQAD